MLSVVSKKTKKKEEKILAPVDAELLLAASEGSLDRVINALARGADPLCNEKIVITPLYQAAANGHLEVVTFLLNQNVYSDKAIGDAFAVSVFNCHRAVVTRFVTGEDTRAKIAADKGIQRIALKWAIKKSNLALVLFLATHYITSFSSLDILRIIKMTLQAEQVQTAHTFLDKVGSVSFAPTVSAAELTEAGRIVATYSWNVSVRDKEETYKLLPSYRAAKKTLELSEEPKESSKIIREIFQKAMELSDATIACAMWRLDNNVTSSSKEHKNIRSIEAIQEFCLRSPPAWRKEQRDISYAQRKSPLMFDSAPAVTKGKEEATQENTLPREGARSPGLHG